MSFRVLKIIKNISQVISENDDHKLILDKITGILAENLESEVCSIYLYEDTRNILVLKATYGLSKESVDTISLMPGEGITGYSFKNREIINLSNPETHPNYVFFKGSGEEKYKSFLSVPLNAGNRTVGVLNIQRISDKRFPPSVVDAVKSICTQIANLLLASKMLQALAGSAKLIFDKETIDIRQMILRGVSHGTGVTSGKAFIFERYDNLVEIKPEKISSVSKELLILEYALKNARRETIMLENHAMKMISEADASIFNVHLLFLEDRSLIDAIRDKISKDNFCIEYAIKLVNDEYQERFSRLKDPVFKEKASDLKDVFLRLLGAVRSLRGEENKRQQKETNGQIIVATELLPSDLLRIPAEKIKGIVCEKGGFAAHVAILAKALNIPFLMGVSGATSQVSENDELILDCNSGILYARPSRQIIEQYHEILKEHSSQTKETDKKPAITSDGEKIAVRANISLLSEASMLHDYGAEGIGLYRTEFLFMIRDHIPPEDVQIGIYSKIINSAKNYPVTIRALDVGADKPLPYLDIPKEDNPSLGWRGIRLLLKHKDLIRTQISAILKAASGSTVKILFPMVSFVSELIEITQIITEIESDLHTRGIPHCEDYQTGIMLEVPSAVFSIEQFLEYVDFMSIGSNDLLQYTFAADRTNEYISGCVSQYNPLFLNILKQIGSVFEKNPNKGLSICGEMAGSPLAIPFLIGAGITELSMSLNRVAVAKRVIRAISKGECRKMLDEAVKFDNTEAVLCLVKQYFFDKNIAEFSA